MLKLFLKGQVEQELLQVYMGIDERTVVHSQAH